MYIRLLLRGPVESLSRDKHIFHLPCAVIIGLTERIHGKTDLEIVPLPGASQRVVIPGLSKELNNRLSAFGRDGDWNLTRHQFQRITRHRRYLQCILWCVLAESDKRQSASNHQPQYCLGCHLGHPHLQAALPAIASVTAIASVPVTIASVTAVASVAAVTPVASVTTIASVPVADRDADRAHRGCAQRKHEPRLSLHSADAGLNRYVAFAESGRENQVDLIQACAGKAQQSVGFTGSYLLIDRLRAPLIGAFPENGVPA